MKPFETIVFAACSSVRESPAENALWFQTFPAYGRYPVGGIIEGAAPDAEFVFDEAAAKDVIAAFRADVAKPGSPGILVDREHFSADRDKASDAMAWAKDIRQDPDGSIWTRWDFTPTGRELWETKTLVNRSPLFACARVGKDYRPVALKSIGMTNTPHFTELSTLAAARAAEVNNKQGEIHMNKVLEELGLAEGASEDEILAAVVALKDKASAAEVQATEAEKEKDEAVAECRRMKCDAFVAAHKDQIADEAKCREVYMKDPALAETMIAACKVATVPEKEPQKLLAVAKAKTPAGTADAAARENARNKAIADYRAAHAGCDFQTAWAACRATSPELFND